MTADELDLLMGINDECANLHKVPTRYCTVGWDSVSLVKRLMEQGYVWYVHQCNHRYGELPQGLQFPDEKLVAGLTVSGKHKVMEEQRRRELNKPPSELEQLRAFKREAEAVMNETRGVAGWHQNGDIATWEEVGLR